jgi:hypothetical protein
MTTFDNRETAFENKYAHDEEIRFKVTSRRNKLLGLWAASRLGKTTAEADAYAKEVILADFAEAGEEDVLHKVLSDLTAGKVDITAEEIRIKMNALLAEAKHQVMTE